MAAISFPPTIITFSTSRVVWEKYCMSSSTPSWREKVNTRSLYWKVVSALGMMVLLPREMAMMRKREASSGLSFCMKAERVRSSSGDSSFRRNTEICSLPLAKSMVSELELRFS